jgi:predicted nucleic acid-binding protein
VYASGIRTTRKKQQQAIDIMANAWPTACLSLQVLSEFSAVALRNGMTVDACQTMVREYQTAWAVPIPTSATLDQALRGVEEHGLGCWDSMIWAVAHERRLDEILTEDGPTGTVVEGVLFLSPFQDASD